MRVVDLARQLLTQYQHFPTAFGYIEARDGSRYYVSSANPQRHILPAPPATALVAKVVMEIK